ncbi:MAG: hypothetical protein KF752_03150 [Pirellulaceae bacterium]|nr:hypothetical protein [Pirellulaceae bacterium]
MMNNGFIQLPRKTINKLRGLGAEYLDLYVAILAAVNYMPDEFQGVKIQPGQMVFSWRNIAERLYPLHTPAINTVRSRISRLEKAGLIETKPIFRFDTSMPIATLLAVSNFDTRSDTRPDTRSDTELIRGEKGKESTVAQAQPSEQFEDFWKAYPPRNGRRLEKQKALQQFSRLKPADIPLVMKAVQSYAIADVLPKDAFRWLRDSWREWLQEPSTNGSATKPPPKPAQRGASWID